MAQERITPARETSVEKSPHPEPMAQERMTPAPARPEDEEELDALAELDLLESEGAYFAEWQATHPAFSTRLFVEGDTLQEALDMAMDIARIKGHDIKPEEITLKLRILGKGRTLESYEPREQVGCLST